MGKPNKPLTPQQMTFCAEYVIDNNATQAATRAGYKVPHVAASRLLSQDKVQLAIRNLVERKTKRTHINADFVLTELARIASTDLREAFNADGTLKPIHDIPEHVARAMSSVEIDELFQGSGRFKKKIGLVKKIKFWEKTKALELIGRNLKLFTDKIEHSGDKENPVAVTVTDDAVRKAMQKAQDEC